MSLNELDSKDQAILKLLQDDAWLTHSEIGEVVNLSPSAVQRRIKRLQSDGTIVGASAQIDPRKTGHKTRIYMLIELHDDRRSSLDTLVSRFDEQTDYISIELLAGSFDVMLTVDCEDIEIFFEFAMKAINTDENIRHVSTHTRIGQLA